jgi:hypothetical protein
MAVACVFRAGIAEAYKEFHRASPICRLLAINALQGAGMQDGAAGPNSGPFLDVLYQWYSIVILRIS